MLFQLDVNCQNFLIKSLCWFLLSANGFGIISVFSCHYKDKVKKQYTCLVRILDVDQNQTLTLEVLVPGSICPTSFMEICSCVLMISSWQTDTVTGRQKHHILGKGANSVQEYWSRIPATPLSAPCKLQLLLILFKLQLWGITPTQIPEFRRPNRVINSTNISWQPFFTCFYDIRGRTSKTGEFITWKIILFSRR